MVATERLPLFKARPDWNKRGPPVSIWFRRNLKRIDPKLTLQFIPPRSQEDPRGLSLEMFPSGAWFICRRLRQSRLLHPKAVWSLVDAHGNPADPGPDTLRLLRLSLFLDSRGLGTKLEDEMDRCLGEMNSLRETRSHSRLMEALTRFTSRWGDRQFTNRIFMKRGLAGC